MKILLVDDEVQVLRGVRRMIEGERDDWEVETALSGMEALELLTSEDFNVVVSDMRMPEMDGAQLLSTVESRYPEVLRIVLSGQADRDTVMRAIRPMHQYLAKPCDPEVLIDVIERAEIFQKTISSTEILLALGQADGLPTVPSVATEIDRELSSDSSSAQSLANVVLQDPVLCAKLLQLANSAIFGLTHPVTEVERAISVLGIDMVRSLALSLAIFKPDEKETAQLAKKIFAHSTHVAAICRNIAKWEHAESEVLHTAFSGGLLHDIGRVLLLNAFQDRYNVLIDRSQTEGQPISILEDAEFGASHAGIGAYLLEMWGLPTPLIESVAAHHDLEHCVNAELATQIVFAANWIANGASEDLLESASPGNGEPFVAKLHEWSNKHDETVKELAND